MSLPTGRTSEGFLAGFHPSATRRKILQYAKYGILLLSMWQMTNVSLMCFVKKTTF